MVDKAFILEWLRYTMSDLNTAKHMFEDVYPKEMEISAWHCQQCAEKTLKAFLVANDIDPPKIHNLEELDKFCQNIDASFSENGMIAKKLIPTDRLSVIPMNWMLTKQSSKPLSNGHKKSMISAS